MEEIIQKELAQELLRTLSNFRKSTGNPTPKYGIRHSEFMLLHILISHNDTPGSGMKVSEISEKLQITPAGATHTINSLEKNGFVERLADPSDRRIVLVKPTAKSLEIMKQLGTERMNFIEGLISHFGEQDSREFIRLLTTAQEYFREGRNNHAHKPQT